MYQYIIDIFITNKMVTIYVLQLEQNKYYVGKTTSPDFRLEQHFNSNGSVWTTKYKMIGIAEILLGCDDFDEDKYTIKYMAEYGIENVRGGSFCEMELSRNNRETIQKMLIGTQNLCYICLKSKHFAKDCDYCIKIKEQVTYENQRWYPFIGWSSNLLPTDRFQFSSEDGMKELRREQFMLGRDQKVVEDWRISTKKSDIDGWEYSFNFTEKYKPICTETCYVRRRKWVRKINYIELKPPTDEKQVNEANSISSIVNILSDTNNCYRCGREGHYAVNCYASKDVNGRCIKD